MAGFREHVLFSAGLGAGFAYALHQIGQESGNAVLAGALCGLAGMLPDLDSDTGKPIKEIFGLLATVGSLFVFHRLRHFELTPAERILAAAFAYVFVRFGVRWFFAKLTVHRGMWHSLPAGLLLAELTFLSSDDVMGEQGSLALAGGVLLGFISHLVLDEIWSFQLKWYFLPSLKNSSGTALKLFSESKLATIATWLVLTVVSYESAARLGYARDLVPGIEQSRQASREGMARLNDRK